VGESSWQRRNKKRISLPKEGEGKIGGFLGGCGFEILILSLIKGGGGGGGKEIILSFLTKKSPQVQGGGGGKLRA